MTIRTKDRDGADLDIASATVGAEEVPVNHLANAAGEVISPATEATLAALNVIAAAVQAAVESMNGKTTAVNTGAIAGTVALDGPTLAALESIQATTGGLTDAQLRASAVLTAHEAPPFMRVGFAEVGSGLQGAAAQRLSLLQTGPGQAVNQSAGNLVITTGTTVNSETVIRSVDTFSGSLLARVKVILSQRIVNQTVRFELADLVGEGLAYTINSSTSVTVTFPSTNPFTAANVGQAMRMSRITGAAGIPGRYAIASVSGLSVTFTVAAWPATGTGTLTLYGWNYIATEYSGTVATNASFDAQRRGWASGNTTATINTTASPGHVGQIAFDVHTAGYADSLVASQTGYQWTNRASRVENLPDPEVPLYLFLVVQNGSVAPASTTTLTVGFLQIEDQGRQKVRIASADPVGSHAVPVHVLSGLLGTQPVSGTVTANIGTGALAAGANAIGDVGIQARANATGAGTPFNYASPATSAGTQVKNAAGRILSVSLTNTSAAVRFVKFFNVSTAPTMGTTSAAYEYAIPAGASLNIAPPAGIAHATGIFLAVTTAVGLTNNTSTAAANDVVGFLTFA